MNQTEPTPPTDIRRRAAAKAAPVSAPPSRLAAWLALLLVLFVLPLAGAAGWIYVRMERELGASEARQTRLRARALAAVVERELHATGTLLESIAARRQFRGAWLRRDFEELVYHLRDLLGLEPALLFASVYEPDGTLRAILPEDPILGQNFSYRDWYRGVIERRAPYVSEVYRTAAAPNPLVVAIAVPVFDDAGWPAGILMAPYTLETLNRKFAALEAGGGDGQPLVLDQRGAIATARYLNSSADPVYAPATDLSRQAQGGIEGDRELSLEESQHWLPILRPPGTAGEGEAQSGSTPSAGDELFVAWSPVPRLGWTVLYLRPAREALAAVAAARTLGLTLGTYLLVIYLVTSALAVALLHRHRQASRELARASAELADLYDNAPCGYHSLDADGLVLRMNQTELAWLGYTSEEVVGRKRFTDLITPEGRELFAREFPDFKERGWVRDLEFEMLRRDGSHLPVLLSATALRDPQGRFLASRSTVYDITERKRILESLRLSNDELVERTAALETANRDLEAFTYSVSHDLRAPLRHMDGFSQILLEKLGPTLDEDSRRQLQRVREAAGQMGALVDDLLALSRVGRRRPRRRAASLAAILLEARAELAATAENHSAAAGGAGQIAWRIGPLPELECDAGLVKQVFLNLLSNAIKFSSQVARPVIEVGSYPLDSTHAVFVRDNGAGFDPRYKAKLFGVFQRLHHQEEFPGTGVGLAIVARIVANHGGRIWAEGEVGRGATFTFTLAAPARPRAAAVAALPAAAASPAAEPAREEEPAR
jgi:PAS domain S-box-containing protein